MTRALSAALLASVLLHVALLALLSAPLAGRPRHAAFADRGKTLQVSMMPPRPGAEPEARPAADAALRPMTPHPAPPAADSLSRLGWDPYLPAELLDERPAVVADIPIDPPELRMRPEGGEIVLSLWIGADGAVENVTVEENTLPAVFAESAVRGFLSARFLPGRKDGRTVKSRMRVAVSYQPLNPSGTAMGAAPPIPAGPARGAAEK